MQNDIVFILFKCVILEQVVFAESVCLHCLGGVASNFTVFGTIMTKDICPILFYSQHENITLICQKYCTIIKKKKKKSTSRYPMQEKLE